MIPKLHWTANDPDQKNNEQHGFISKEGENIYTYYELKTFFIISHKKIYSTVPVFFFGGYRSFSLSGNKKNNKSKIN